MSDIGNLLKVTRAARRLSLRAAADEIGVPFNTLFRVERGGECAHSAAVRIHTWIHGPLDGLTAEQAFANGYAAGVVAAEAALRALRP